MNQKLGNKQGAAKVGKARLAQNQGWKNLDFFEEKVFRFLGFFRY